MIETHRAYTVDELEALGLPWDNVLARDSEDQHRWYTLWRLVFRDPADGTHWAFWRAEDRGDNGEIPWYYAYDGFERPEKITCRRVEPREVTEIRWDYVKAAP